MLSPNLLMRGVAGAAYCGGALPVLTFLNRPRQLQSWAPTESKDLEGSIRNLNDAGFVLAQYLISGQAKNRNLVFSPLSIHAALSLLTAGAGGATKDKLLSFLKAKNPSDLHSLYSDLFALVLADESQSGGPKLSFANGVWTDKSVSLKPSFKPVLDTVYKANTSQVDFQNKATEAVEQVNSWAERKTEGLIKQILSSDSVDELTRLVCTNAFYFKGVWTEKFDKSRTKNYDFYLANGSEVKVPFMTNLEKQAVCAYDGFKVLRLPYKQCDYSSRFSMYLILPDAKDGLPALAEKMCTQSGFLDLHIPYVQVRMRDFRIPKFKISYEFEASKVLERLGILGEGFDSMVDSEDEPVVYVSSIYQKAVIEVDENGTEAVAVTSTGMMASPWMRPKPEPVVMDFVADHPFMYVIRDILTGTVLVIGQVFNPQ